MTIEELVNDLKKFPGAHLVEFIVYEDEWTDDQEPVSYECVVDDIIERGYTINKVKTLEICLNRLID